MRQKNLLQTIFFNFIKSWPQLPPPHLDTVSRQIFGDIEETQFSGSKKKVHVHLKNAFPGGITNWKTGQVSLKHNIFGLPPTLPHPTQGGYRDSL